MDMPVAVTQMLDAMPNVQGSVPNQPSSSRVSRYDPDRYAQIIAEARIPKRHDKFPLACKRGAGWLAKHDTLLALVLTGSGVLVGMCGIRGTGKTLMAVQAIKAAARVGMTARYGKAMEFYLALRSGSEKNGSELEALGRWTLPGLLVLDEAHVRGETAWEDRMLTHLVDTRYDAMKHTVLISNQTEAEFCKSLGTSIVSRMSECGGLIHCDWPSYRTGGDLTD